MDFHSFEVAARRIFEEIPPAYRTGVDGLTIKRERLAHPDFEDVFTLGECLTESYPSGWEGPETVRSLIILHWGSFRALAEIDPEFDWREQIYETVTHELQHHLESLVDADDLGDVDDAMEQSFRRYRGDSFEADYYRRGERLGPCAWAVEDEVFLEREWRGQAYEDFIWDGRRYRIACPEPGDDVHFVHVDGLGGGARREAGRVREERDVTTAGERVQIVLARRRSWSERLRSVFRRREPAVGESEARAVEMETDG